MKTRLCFAGSGNGWWCALTLCILGLMLSGVSVAQWSISPKGNTAVCTATQDQYLPQEITDGAHGAIIVWQDNRNGAGNTDIYAQRLDSTGVPRWAANGVPVCTATGTQVNPVIASDSLGGAVIAWLDNRTTPTEIYVQRLSPSGVSLWTLNGQRIASPVNTTGYAEVAIAGNGHGGAILAVTYLFSSAAGDWDVWSFRVDSSGVVSPLMVVSNSGLTREYQPTIAGDGTGGAIICFRSTPVNTFAPGSLYAARLTSTGTVPVWGSQSSKAICVAANDRFGHVITGDRAGGAIFAWADQRTGGTDPYKLYVQRVDSAGNLGWSTNGVLITSPGSVSSPRILADGTGGALLVWDDQPPSSDAHAYAGRIDNNGQPQAAQRICLAATGSQFLGSMASDGLGGAVVTWFDTRVSTNLDIYAQLVNSTGVPQWASTGVPICTALYNQALPVVTSDGANGGIIAWYDFRTNGTNSDIYAQRVNHNGVLGVPQKQLTASIAFPATPASTDYRLFGIPGNQVSVAAVKPADFLAGNQGTDWRMLGDNGAASNYLVELAGTTPLTSGQGYWLLQKGTLNINRLVTLPVLDTAGSYTIPLHSGWNIITDPFDVQVPWSGVGRLNHRIDTIAAATAQGYSGSYAASSNLAPFTGYYFFNDSAYGLTSSLVIPYPSTDSPTLAKVTPAPVAWQLQLILRSDINTDSENYLGISPVASPGRDMMDAHKPPLFLDQAFLCFPRPEWDRVYSRFSSDFRPSLGDGQVWTFEVANPRKSDATIQVLGVEHVPSGSKVVLMNADNSVPVDLRSNNTYRFKSTTPRQTFTLIVGKQAFVDEKIAESVPKSFALLQNYPNPFNPSTSIQVNVPHAAAVRVDVYSILGQLTATLIDDQLEAGVHTILWDSKNQKGQQVSSGVYFYRLLVDGNLLQTRKMLLEK